MRKRIGHILTAVALGACESIVNPKLQTIAPIPVVDAWFTSLHNKSYVKIFQTNQFESSSDFEAVKGATVRIEHEKSGQVHYLSESSQPGLYHFEPVPSVQTGTYRLVVKWRQEQFVAQDEAKEKVGLDSVFFRFKFGVPTFENGYYATVVFKDPPKRKDFYLWECTINSKPAMGNQINLLEDDRFDGKTVNFEIPKAFKKGDTLEFTLFPLSKESYQYYLSLRNLVNNGSPILSHPANPPSNIKGGALGYFCVSNPSSIKAIVQ